MGTSARLDKIGSSAEEAWCGIKVRSRRELNSAESQETFCFLEELESSVIPSN